MSFWKKCPLLAAVIVSGLVIEGAGVANGVKSGEIENPASWKQPALASVFIDLKQGVYPWSDRSVQTAAMDAADVQKDRITEETGGQTNEENGGEKAGQMANADRDADHKNGTGDKNEAGVSGNAVPGKAAEATQEAEEEPLEFTHVDKEYFADAVFIGDSRTQGLYEYSNLADVATFYSKTSLTVYNLFEKPKDFIREGDEKLTLEQALSRHQFKKVYLMIGINEMGTGTPESFLKPMRGRYIRFGSCSRTQLFSCRESCAWRGRKTLPIQYLITQTSISAMWKSKHSQTERIFFILTSTKRSAMKTAIYTRIGHLTRST